MRSGPKELDYYLRQKTNFNYIFDLDIRFSNTNIDNLKFEYFDNLYWVSIPVSKIEFDFEVKSPNYQIINQNDYTRVFGRFEMRFTFEDEKWIIEIT